MVQIGHPHRSMPKPSRRARPGRAPARPAGRRPHGSRLTLALGGAVLAALALLGAAVATGPLADAWHPVVTVDGQTANRSDLRARMAIDAALLDARRAAARALLSAGRITPDDYTRLAAAVDASAADPLRAAVDGLTVDLVLGAEAARRGLSPAVDTASELVRAAQADAALRVQAVVIAQPNADAPAAANGWPGPAPGTAPAAALAAARAEASGRARSALAAGTPPADVAGALAAAGWRATSLDEWIPADGPVDGLPDGLVALLRAGAPGQGFVEDDGSGDTGADAGAGRVADAQAASPLGVPTGGLDSGALGAWAAARADERALRASLLEGWRTRPLPLVRVAELVIGPADVPGVAGEYRSFGHLVVSRLPPAEHGPGGDADAAARLAAGLRALAPSDRAARFAALVAAAGGAGAADALHASGETPFFTRDQVLPALGDLAWAPAAAAGDVLGPVTTAAGPELFLLRAAFTGTLDDRSNAAAVEARTSPDLLAMARRVAPAGEWPRADGTLWRAQAEGDGDAGAEAAYAGGPLGATSAPFVLAGEIVVAVPLERTTGQAPPGALARLEARGFEAWLAGRLRAASVARDPEPLPGVSLETASPGAGSPADSGGAVPTPQLPSVSAGS